MSTELSALITAITRLDEYAQAGKPQIRRLTGEAYYQTTHEQLVRESAFIGGVKRKKRYSEAALQVSTERLRQARENAAA